METPKKVQRQAPSPDNGVSARKEAAAINLEELEAQADHDRRQGFKKAVHWGMLWFFWLISAVSTVTILSWAWHYLTPLAWHFLSDAQLAKIEAIIFGGIISIVSQSVAKKL